MTTFPSTITPDLNTRAGRMLDAGDVRVTVTSSRTGEHITIRFKAHRKDEAGKKRWPRCPLAEASHVFVEVPNPDGWGDKVGTFYPESGRWFADDHADPARVWAAAEAARWLDASEQASPQATYLEESRCGRCARRLTDPVSIERGIGPECYGKETGSQHEVKHPKAAQVAPEEAPVEQMALVEEADNPLAR